MSKHHWIQFILVLCVFAVPCHGRTDLLSAEQARALLQQCGDDLLAITAFECDISFTSVAAIDGGGRMSLPANRFRFAFAQPNSFSIKSLEEVRDANVPHILSSGQRLHLYQPVQKRFAVLDAPESLAAFLSDAELHWHVGNVGSPLSYLRSAMPSLSTVSYASVTHVENGEFNGVRTRVLELGTDQTSDAPNDGGNAMPSFRVSIRAEAPHLPVVIEYRRVPSLSREASEDLGLTMPFREIVSTVRLDWRTDHDLQPEQFVFQPNADDVQVDPVNLFGVRREMQADRTRHDAQSQRVGNSAPEFSLPDIAGTLVELSEHRGKDVVILDFWATWCVPCIRAMPEILAVVEKFRDQGVVFYAVNQREAKEVVERFINRKSWDMTVLLDARGDVGKQYGADAIPTTVIIDPDGTIRYWHQGYTADISKQMTEILKTLVSEAAGGDSDEK